MDEDERRWQPHRHEEALAVEPGRIEARMELCEDLMMAAGDFVHAGSVVAIADSLTSRAASPRSPTAPRASPPKS